MHSRLSSTWGKWRSLVVGGAALLAFVAAPRFLSAQAPVKRPLSYDTYDYWRSISGTRLSRDGQWLAYALTSQGDDGDLVGRNLKAGKDYHAARGSSPVFTPDGRLVIFTVAPPKADELRAGGAGAAAEEPATPQPTGRAGGANVARTSMGIMTLADGKVTTIDRVAEFRVPEESSAWLAYHRPSATGRGGGGRAGAGAGRGGATRGATGGAQPAGPPSAAGHRERAGRNGAREAQGSPGRSSSCATSRPVRKRLRRGHGLSVEQGRLMAGLRGLVRQTGRRWGVRPEDGGWIDDGPRSGPRTLQQPGL